MISELGLPELLPLGLQLDELSLFGSEAEEGGEDLLRGLECVPVALRYHGDVVILHVLVKAATQQLLEQQQGFYNKIF